MPEADQLRLLESIEWRMWYIAEPAFQSNFNALVKHVHAMPPADKQRLHDGYHNNAGTQPQCGEKITGRLCMILAPEFCQELHNSGKSPCYENGYYFDWAIFYVANCKRLPGGINCPSCCFPGFFWNINLWWPVVDPTDGWCNVYQRVYNLSTIHPLLLMFPLSTIIN